MSKTREAFEAWLRSYQPRDPSPCDSLEHDLWAAWQAALATPPAAPAPAQGEPNNDEVICPNCVHQFRAIPANVQKMLLDAGYEPPFRQPSPAVGQEPDERYKWAERVAVLHEAIARALEYDLRPVMRRSDIRKLLLAIGRRPEEIDAEPATPEQAATADDLPLSELQDPPGTILVCSQQKRAYLFLSMTADRMNTERANAAAHGVQDVRDFVFVLDGERFVLTFDELRDRLSAKPGMGD